MGGKNEIYSRYRQDLSLVFCLYSEVNELKAAICRLVGMTQFSSNIDVTKYSSGLTLDFSFYPLAIWGGEVNSF